MTKKKTPLPTGYKAHRGKKCPVDPDTHVACIVRTGEGLGHSAVVRASMHDWNPDHHVDGLGAVVAYKVMSRGDQHDPIKLRHRWGEYD